MVPLLTEQWYKAYSLLTEQWYRYARVGRGNRKRAERLSARPLGIDKILRSLT